MARTVIIVGATGLFGGHLARQLIADGHYNVVCAGRHADKLDAFCKAHGGSPETIDITRRHEAADILARLKPFAVVDTAGPFQRYGDDPFAFARMVIEAGAHYLDIADGSAFVAGFSCLDGLAKAKGVVALSGASSTPALSSAAADVLTAGLGDIDSIETAIVPGNQTPRGLSVMRAILGQVGQPLRMWKNGAWEPGFAWTDPATINLVVRGEPGLHHRRASLVDTPDVRLFPERYGAKTVSFRAGLELTLLHRALEAGGWMVRRGLLRSLEPFSAAALRMASWLQGLGSDRGGMSVRVIGRNQATGQRQVHAWNLIVADGHGPKIPVQPVAVLLTKIKRGEISPGARACLGEATLAELEGAMSRFGVVTERRARAYQPLFQQILGAGFDTLPSGIRALHDTVGETSYAGTADIDGAEGFWARLAARVAGFPASATDVPVRVTIAANEYGETWTRRFGAHVFRSHLTRSPGGKVLVERFGPFSFRIALTIHARELHYPVHSGRAFGLIPIPAPFLPESITREYVDEEGHFRFDVLVRLRNGRRIAHYRGILNAATTTEPADQGQRAQPTE